MPGFFVDENLAQGLPAGTNAPVQAGVSDYDPGTDVTDGITVPWQIDPEATFIDGRCTVEVELDAGMALHKPLPQREYGTDTLASAYLDDYNVSEQTDLAVNTVSLYAGKQADVVQRMAASTYRFVLRGWALRLGYKVPIPGIRSVAGVPAVPAERQWAVNELIGNVGGLPLWLGQWELHYWVALAPREKMTEPQNLAAHIRSDQELPAAIDLPHTQPDQHSVGQPAGPRPGPVGGVVGAPGGIPGAKP